MYDDWNHRACSTISDSVEPGEPAESATSEVPSMDTRVAATITMDDASNTASSAGLHEERVESGRSSDGLEDCVPTEDEVLTTCGITPVWTRSAVNTVRFFLFAGHIEVVHAEEITNTCRETGCIFEWNVMKAGIYLEPLGG